MDEVEGLKNKTNGTESRGSSAKERQERIIQLKEREKTERLKKLEELKEHALQAARLREEQDSRRRKHFEELGRKDEERRKQCEERRRMLDEERRLAFQSKYEAKKSSVKVDRRPGFAFGSCTPRQLDNQDGFLWKSQYALNVSSDSGTMRAASASDLRQTGELRIFCGRRKTDLTPTLPIRTLESGRCSSRTSGRVSASLSKLDRERSPLTRSKSTTHLRLTRTEKLRQALAKGSPGATTPMSRPPSSMSSLMTSSTHSGVRTRNLGARKARPTSVHITGVSTEAQRPSPPPPPPKTTDGPRGNGNPLSPTSGMSRSFSGKSQGNKLHQTPSPQQPQQQQQLKSRPHSANSPAVAPPPPMNNNNSSSSSSSSNVNANSSAKGNKAHDKKPMKSPEHSQPKKQIPGKKLENKVKSNVKESIETKEEILEESLVVEGNENELIVISSLHDDPPPLEVKMEKVKEIVTEAETKEESFDSKEGPETLVDFDSPPPPEELNVGQTEIIDPFNIDVNGSKIENNTSLESETEGAKKLLTEEDAKAALAEKRRLAREAHEKEMARLEAERLAEEQRQREEEENAERIIREAKKMEEERLRLAIEEQQKKEAQDKLRKEEEEVQRIEREREEAAAAREAERIRLEMEERLRREEEERLERRRRVEAIMSRTRKKEGDIRNEGGQENLQVNEEDPPATATFNNAYNNNNTEFLINFDGSGGTIETSLAVPPTTNHITSIQGLGVGSGVSVESSFQRLGGKLDAILLRLDSFESKVGRWQGAIGLRLDSIDASLETQRLKFDLFSDHISLLDEKLSRPDDPRLDSKLNGLRMDARRHFEVLSGTLRRSEENLIEKLDKVNASLAEVKAGIVIGTIGGKNKAHESPGIPVVSNKITNMFEELLKRSDTMESQLKDTMSIANASRRDIADNFRSLTQRRNNNPDTMSAVIIEALASVESMSTALGRRMAELSRSIQERFEIVSRTQNGFLESCHRIQEGVPMIEEKIGEVLDKILDSFVNNTRQSEERLKSLTSLIEAGCSSPDFPPDTTTEEGMTTVTASPNVLDSLTDKEIEEISQNDYQLRNFTEEEKKQLWKKLFRVPEE